MSYIQYYCGRMAMGKVESFDAVEISADVATKFLVTDRLRHIHIKRNKPGVFTPG